MKTLPVFPLQLLILLQLIGCLRELSDRQFLPLFPRHLSQTVNKGDVTENSEQITTFFCVLCSLWCFCFTEISTEQLSLLKYVVSVDQCQSAKKLLYIIMQATIGFLESLFVKKISVDTTIALFIKIINFRHLVLKYRWKCKSNFLCFFAGIFVVCFKNVLLNVHFHHSYFNNNLLMISIVNSMPLYASFYQSKPCYRQTYFNFSFVVT